uniref:Uncharacterized protein LOC114348457 isoform X1 n=1 Tax=Diabrotica virgifera virgifera TaxID=50390 RepID=A0A6P7HAX1_DIAVI
MTPRQQRLKRKQWRTNLAAFRQRQKALKETGQHLENNTPPNSSDEENVPENIRADIGRRRAIQNRVKRHREKVKTREKIKKLEAALEKYKKRYQRLKAEKQKKELEMKQPRTPLTPLTNTDLIIDETPYTPRKTLKVDEIKKKILFGQVMEEQLRHSYKECEQNRTKQVIKKLMSGNIIRKYGLKKYCSRKIGFRNLSPKKYQNKSILVHEKKRSVGMDTVRRQIHKYFNEDLNSRICAGKIVHNSK